MLGTTLSACAVIRIQFAPHPGTQIILGARLDVNQVRKQPPIGVIADGVGIAPTVRRGRTPRRPEERGRWKVTVPDLSPAYRTLEAGVRGHVSHRVADAAGLDVFAGRPASAQVVGHQWPDFVRGHYDPAASVRPACAEPARRRPSNPQFFPEPQQNTLCLGSVSPMTDRYLSALPSSRAMRSSIGLRMTARSSGVMCPGDIRI